MRCRRIRRELLWLARFGELGPSSQPHLDHLASCRGCRDEVGYDRETVRHLRAALAARLEGMEPSPDAWEGILRRAQSPDPAPSAWTRWTAAVGRLRTATAMAGTGLALVLALNMEIVAVPAVPQTDAGAPPSVTSLEQVPRLPTGRTALVAFMRQSEAQTSESRPDPEALLVGPTARVSPPPAPASDPAEDGGEGTPQVRVTFRSAVAPPAPTLADAIGPEPAAAVEPASPPVDLEAGRPS